MANNMTLYSLSEQMALIEATLEANGGELTPELESAWEETRESLIQKVDNYNALVQKLKAYSDNIKAEICRLAKENEPPVTTQPPTEPAPTGGTSTSGVGEPVVRPCRLSVKRQLKSREELETVISTPSSHLDDISEETPIEFSINE